MKILSSNALKVIAAITMLIDHIGLIFFPETDFFRIIGRIAFPIFAYTIAEGCRYTKNRLKYFLTIALFGLAIQLIYYAATKDTLINILVTLSLSIILIYSIGNRDGENFNLSLFASLTILTYIICSLFKIDYGFWGCMLPVFAYITPEDAGSFEKTLIFSAGLLILSASLGKIQLYSLLSVPFIFMYNGTRGKLNMKYFFYIFYPLHLFILQSVSYIINLNK